MGDFKCGICHRSYDEEDNIEMMLIVGVWWKCPRCDAQNRIRGMK